MGISLEPRLSDTVWQPLDQGLGPGVPRLVGKPGAVAATRGRSLLFGWHYFSNATCIIRPHLFCVFLSCQGAT